MSTARNEARAKVFAPKSAPLEFDGTAFTVVEPPADLVEAALQLGTMRMRAATIAAASLRFDGAPFFDGPAEALRLPLSRAKLPELVMSAVLAMAKPAEPAEPEAGPLVDTSPMEVPESAKAAAEALAKKASDE